MAWINIVDLGCYLRIHKLTLILKQDYTNKGVFLILNTLQKTILA